MNIRRSFLALAAMILGVGFLGAFPQQAQAAINCTPAPKSITDWPYSGSVNPTEYCVNTVTGTGASSANGVAVADGLHSFPKLYQRSAYTELKNRGKFYVFRTQSDWQIWHNQTFGVAAPAVSASAPGFTYKDSVTFAPIYTAVFVLINGNQTNLKNTATHEAGHWLDYYWCDIFSGAGTTVLSARNAYIGNLTEDWDEFDSLPNCGPPNGVFRGKRNYQGNYICSGANGVGGAPIYPGVNSQVLAAAWPQFFEFPKEVFAEEVAKDAGFPDGGGASSLTSYLFGRRCTNTIVHSLVEYGTKPGVAPTVDANGNPVVNGPVVTWPPTGFVCASLN
jgi:hypothetical protein